MAVLISALRERFMHDRLLSRSLNLPIRITFIQAASDLGLSGAHEQLVVAYLNSVRRQRTQSLKTIDATFKDFKESRLNDDTYTREPRFLHAHPI